MKPGIYDITNEAYHTSPGVSRSSLELIRRSPAVYFDRIVSGYRDSPSKSMLDGTAVHCAVLEPERFSSLYFRLPEINKRTKAGKEELADLQAQYPGRIFLNEDTFDMVKGIAKSVKEHEIAKDLLTQGVSERSIYWNDPDTSVLCKCRPDYLRDDLIVDLKTTTSAHPKEFIQSVLKYNYMMQAAYYADGAKLKDFYFIAVEKVQPYLVSVFKVSEQMMNTGRILYKEALHQLKDCLKTNVWPGYYPIVYELELPPWYLSATYTEINS